MDIFVSSENLAFLTFWIEKYNLFENPLLDIHKSPGKCRHTYSVQHNTMKKNLKQSTQSGAFWLVLSQ